MSTHRCPGQDVRFWKPKDIFEVRCPYCGKEIEFWKDDPFRNCPGCAQVVSNPRIDLGCAKWCKYAEECLGSLPDALVAEAPVVDRLKALLEKRLTAQPASIKLAHAVCTLAETLMFGEGGDPCIVKSAALLVGTLMTENGLSHASSATDNPLRDPHVRKTLLEQAGIETSLTTEICSIVDAVISGNTPETLDSAIVWDAVQLERLSRVRESDTGSTTPAPMNQIIRTRSGKQMAEQYSLEEVTSEEKLS